MSKNQSYGSSWQESNFRTEIMPAIITMVYIDKTIGMLSTEECLSYVEP